MFFFFSLPFPIAHKRLPRTSSYLSAVFSGQPPTGLSIPLSFAPLCSYMEAIYSIFTLHNSSLSYISHIAPFECLKSSYLCAHHNETSRTHSQNLVKCRFFCLGTERIQLRVKVAGKGRVQLVQDAWEKYKWVSKGVLHPELQFYNQKREEKTTFLFLSRHQASIISSFSMLGRGVLLSLQGQTRTVMVQWK